MEPAGRSATWTSEARLKAEKWERRVKNRHVNSSAATCQNLLPDRNFRNLVEKALDFTQASASSSAMLPGLETMPTRLKT